MPDDIYLSARYLLFHCLMIPMKRYAYSTTRIGLGVWYMVLVLTAFMKTDYTQMCPKCNNKLYRNIHTERDYSFKLVWLELELKLGG